MDAQQRADYVERWARVLELAGEARITGRIISRWPGARSRVIITGAERAQSIGATSETLGYQDTWSTPGTTTRS